MSGRKPRGEEYAERKECGDGPEAVVGIDGGGGSTEAGCRLVGTTGKEGQDEFAGLPWSDSGDAEL